MILYFCRRTRFFFRLKFRLFSRRKTCFSHTTNILIGGLPEFTPLFLGHQKQGSFDDAFNNAVLSRERQITRLTMMRSFNCMNNSFFTRYGYYHFYCSKPFPLAILIDSFTSVDAFLYCIPVVFKLFLPPPPSPTFFATTIFQRTPERR